MTEGFFLPCDRSELGVAAVRWIDERGPGWLRFSQPSRIVSARSPDEVLPTLRAAEEWADGGWAVGFVAYEAAPAFEPAIQVRPPEFPLLAWFALYDREPEWFAEIEPPAECELPEVEPGISREVYERAFNEARCLMADGDIYQLNLTYRMPIRFQGAGLTTFAALCGVEPPPYATYLNLGDFELISLSPEMFIERSGSQVRMRPMKGTALPTDPAEALSHCPKSRAENVMIVDMVRNDLGRVAKTGSVHVSELLAVESHRTVLQMTSTVEAVCDCSLVDLFAATFPPASVTGAPKISACSHIARLETTPRGVYCGAIGVIGPSKAARFSVGIRTATVDSKTGQGCYGVGSGLVWDSETKLEWDECLLKSQVLREPAEPWRLLESMPLEGPFELHIERMRLSAETFGIPFDQAAFMAAVARAEGDGRKLRLLLDRTGRFEAQRTYSQVPDIPLRVELASAPVWSGDWRLRHKSTGRSIYIALSTLARKRGFDDVLLFNERGELTSFSRGSALFLLNGEWSTPPRECGCLPGTGVQMLRREGGPIAERILTLGDLTHVEAIEFVNALTRPRAVWLSDVPVPA